jgi:hypothetical protein
MASGKKVGKRAAAASNSLAAPQSAFDKPTEAARRSPSLLTKGLNHRPRVNL